MCGVIKGHSVRIWQESEFAIEYAIKLFISFCVGSWLKEVICNVCFLSFSHCSVIF